MLKRNLFIIAIIGLVIALTGSIFGQTSKRNRTSRNLKPVVKSINQQTPADWNERQSQDARSGSVQTAVKQKTGNALDAGFTLSDDLINEAKTKRQTTNRTNRRRTKPARNLTPDYGGLDPTDERPEFNPAANRQRNRAASTTQTNLLPYMEQQNVIKRNSNTSRRNSSSLNGSTNRTKSRKKYANQEISYRQKSGKTIGKNGKKVRKN